MKSTLFRVQHLAGPDSDSSQHDQHVQLSVYGGASKQTQVRAYRSGVDILVATPGRLMDLVSTSAISLDYCTLVILDEADRMLSMGFETAIMDVIQQVLFSHCNVDSTLLQAHTSACEHTPCLADLQTSV